MKQKLIICTIGLLLSLSSFALALDNQWTENLDQAEIKAQQNQKYIFVNFSGSDWCHWCITMEKEILNTVEFKEFAKDNLILVSIDFPKRKKQDKALKQRNDALAKEYGIRGFPSVAIIDPAGELVTITGYRRGGAKNYIKHLEQIIADSKAK